MHSTLTLKETEPHEVPAIAPDVVPAAWADKVLADITGDTKNPASDQQPDSGSGAAAPTVDTTFRATVTDDIRLPDAPLRAGSWAKSAAVVFTFALCSALAVAAWQHYGDAARQTISNWAAPFGLTSSPEEQKTGLAEQTDTPAVQASAADQTPPAAPAQPPEGLAPAAAAPDPDTAQTLQSMARDLAAMGQQIEQLKAGIAELKAAQHPMARDVARTSEVKSSEVKPSGAQISPRMPRPKMPAPQRAATAPARQPTPAYSPAQAAAPPPLPQTAAPVAPPQSAPPSQATAQPDDEPVIRPPMPLRQ